MKAVVRNVVFYSFALFALTQILPGVTVEGGLPILFLGGAILSVMFVVVKPILNIISIPLNILTLGLFSFFSNIILLFSLTLVVPEIQINPFTFSGFSYSGFAIPKADFNQIMAFAVSGFVLSAIITFLTWLIRK